MEITNFTKVLLLIAVFIFSQMPSASAQENSGKVMNEKKEIVVPVIKQVGSLKFGCLKEAGVFGNEYELQIRAQGSDDCVNPADLLGVDFDKQTLIGYQIAGDCFARGRAEVFRSDDKKTFRVKIYKKSGGCRAGGRFHSWIVLDKIPADYKVEFSEAKTGDANELKIDLLEDILSLTENSRKLKTRDYDMDNCVRMFFREQFVIRSQTEFLKTVRDDASRKACTDKLEELDYGKEILLGVGLITGYCRLPAGLKYQVMRDDRRKRYVVFITYDDPRGRTCRALINYDLWLAVPKPPAGYAVKFEVASVFNKRYPGG